MRVRRALPLSPQSDSNMAIDYFTQTGQDIKNARADLKKLADDLELSLYTYEKYGKDFVKSCNLSPDSFIQMAIQLAFFR